MSESSAFFDHDGTKSFPTVFSRRYRHPAGDGSFLLPWLVVIDPRMMALVYCEAAAVEQRGESFRGPRPPPRGAAAAGAHSGVLMVRT